MDKEYEVLIDLCSHYLNGDKFIFDTDVNYKKLFLYAKGHNLLGVLHCALLNAKNKSDLPESFLSALENKFFDLIFLSNAQINMLEDVKTLYASVSARISRLKAQHSENTILCLKAVLWAI